MNSSTTYKTFKPTKIFFVTLFAKAIFTFKECRNGFKVLFILAYLFFSAGSLNAQVNQRGSATNNTSNSTTLIINKPTGVIAGDVMIAVVFQYNSSSNASITPPTGWTLIDNATFGNSSRLGTTYYKVAGSSEGSSYSFSFSSGTNYIAGAISAFYNVNSSSVFDVTPGTISVSGSSTSVTASSITTATNNAAVLMLGMAGGSNNTATWSGWNTATSPGALTELTEASRSRATAGLAWATQTSAGSTGTGSAKLNNSQRNGGLLIALTYAPTQFRSRANGNWNAASTWQQSTDGGNNWINATTTPTGTDGLVTIQSGHTVTLTADATVSGLTMNGGGTLDVNTFALTGTGTMTIASNGTLLVGGSSNFPSGFGYNTLNSGSTVNYDNAGTQTISNQTYSNLTLSGSGAKSIPSGTSITGNLSIAPTGSATASIAAGATVTTGTLTLGGLSRINGTWGSNSSSATYKDNNYFAATTGIVTVTTDNRSLTAAFSGITTSQSICYGTLTVTLSGTVSSGSVYPLIGETVGVTINGVTQNASITDGVGGFTINYSTGSIPVGTYTINYSYAGNTVLKAAANDIATTLTVYGLIANNTIVYTNGLYGSVCGTAVENSNLVLTAPEGLTFIRVDFASYGNPTGDCTTGFTLGTCNQSNSLTITQGYLLGNNTATIPATNAVFVDPCSGTVKLLSVKASYLKPICVGDTPGPITGAAPSGGNGSYTYYWEASTTGSSSGFIAAAGTNNGQNYSPGALTQTTWYRRTVTSGGCSDSSVPIQMSVNQTKPASITIAANPSGTICSGTSVTFTATPVNGGTAPTYQWTKNGSNVGTNSATYSCIPVNNDVVTCVLTSNYICPTGNPATSNAVTMIVYPQIANNIFDFSTGPYTTICATSAENGTAVLTAASGNIFVNVGFASYGTPTGSCSSFAINPTCNATSSQSVTEGYLLGNNTATIPVNNGIFGDPCSGTAKHYYVQATYSTPICSGNSPGTITGMLPTGGTGPGTYTYLWESSITNASSGFGPASGTYNGQNYAPGNLTQTTWYRRTVYSGGCSNTSSVIQITVIPTLPVSISIVATKNPIYEGTSVTFTATPVNGGTTPAYQWKVNGTNAGTNNSTFTYNPAINDVVSCVLTSNATPCLIGSPATSNTINMTVNLNKWKGDTSVDWSTGSNWLGQYPPPDGYDVEYASDASNNLQLDKNQTIIGNLKNLTVKSLIIPPAKSLTVNNIITTDGNYDRIIIKADPTLPNGSLIFTQPLLNTSVYATVEMYSKGNWSAQGDSILNADGITYTNYHYNWQYFGVPLTTLKAEDAFYGSYVRRWVESGDSFSNHWLNINNQDILEPFKGYEITQKVTTGKMIVFQGQLVNSNLTSGPLTITYNRPGYPNALYPGQYVFANPYTAAIDIRYLTFGAGAQQTVYLYNTGSFAAWTGISGGISTGVNPGQYLSIPQNVAGQPGIPVQVPSMQAMLIRPVDITIPTNYYFNINYNSVIVKNATLQRSPSINAVKSTDKVGVKIDVKSTHAADRMWLFSEPTSTYGFDNGWDGQKILGSALTPQIYAIEKDGNYQINTVPDINGTELAFQAGQDVEDTLTFTNMNMEKQYAGVYLVDLLENRTIDITTSGTQYAFMAESTPTPVTRFKIVTRTYEKNAPDAETKLKVFSAEGAIFVQNLGNLDGECSIYDIAGHYLMKVPFGANAVKAVTNSLRPGAYVATATTANEKISKRLIVR